MGMVPFANASNFVMNNPTFYDPQGPPDYVASGESQTMNILAPEI